MCIYCFGCHKGGGLFQFVMEAEKLAWRDAVELLARKAGVEIPREDDGGEGARREALLELNKRVAGSFHWLLCEEPQAEHARKYLASRAVTREIIDSFQLGFAPPDREWLHKFLLQKSYSDEFLAQTGLFMQGSRSGTATLFANRIMFPIVNARGEMLAFGGRALGDAQPKYLNSPETAFFRKGENLFGHRQGSPRHRSCRRVRAGGGLHGRSGHASGRREQLRGSPGHGPHGAPGAAPEALRAERGPGFRR